MSNIWSDIPGVTYASGIESKECNGVLMAHSMFFSGCKYPVDIPRKHKAW